MNLTLPHVFHLCIFAAKRKNLLSALIFLMTIISHSMCQHVIYTLATKTPIGVLSMSFDALLTVSGASCPATTGTQTTFVNPACFRAASMESRVHKMFGNDTRDDLPSPNKVISTHMPSCEFPSHVAAQPRFLLSSIPSFADMIESVHMETIEQKRPLGLTSEAALAHN